eukprot:m.40834 g.40834  ORF g.40834 m.40834 type:complete len:368 (+) comp18631_c0_seq2:140-1243(+)
MASLLVLDRFAPNVPVFLESQRQPTQFRGDWQSVLATDTIEVAASGFEWTEGPVWVPQDKALYFTDTITATIFKLDTKGCSIHITNGGGYDGKNCPDISSLAEPGSNGMTIDPRHPSTVVICQHPTHRVVKSNIGEAKPGTPFHELDFTVVADNIDGKPFNSPNDVVVAMDGAVWFTDPMYGLMIKERFADEWTADGSYTNQIVATRTGVCGVYRVDPISNAVTLATSLQYRPNGLAFSREGDKLYISDSTIGHPLLITEYPVDASTQTLKKASFVFNCATLGVALGTNANRPRLGDEGIADGMKIDEAGLIWSTMSDGLCVFDPRTKEVICEVIFGTNVSNLWFGDDGDVWLTGLGHVWKLKRKMK